MATKKKAAVMKSRARARKAAQAESRDLGREQRKRKRRERLSEHAEQASRLFPAPGGTPAAADGRQRGDDGLYRLNPDDASVMKFPLP